MRLGSLLEKAKSRSDYDYMLWRRDYYMRRSAPFQLPSEDSVEKCKMWCHYVGSLKGFRPKTFHSAYYLDQRAVTRYFPPSMRWSFCPGDVYFTPKYPTIVKSRLLTGDNSNSILLKLDKLRHFLFLNDTIPFREKQDRVIFRGKIRHSRVRSLFMEKFYGSTWVDCGVVGSNDGWPQEWFVPKKTLREHLEYKFIMALEGNDVASNLKWVMSSNSIAVMTRPTCETWFMEGYLRPDYHYIEVKEDFSDLEEKINYYIRHPEEAEAIVRHAHEFIAPFRDSRREQLIQLMVLDKYLRLSNQK